MKQHITIAYWMAKGMDTYAHTACIKAGGYTIAVLANGLDICYLK
jgi:DNA processing protein